MSLQEEPSPGVLDVERARQTLLSPLLLQMMERDDDDVNTVKAYDFVSAASSTNNATWPGGTQANPLYLS